MIPEGWENTHLGNCCIRNPEYGANASSIEYDACLPRYIRITDIDDNGNLSSETRVSIPLDGNERYALEQDDFLFARSGATVGKTYLYKDSDGLAIYAGYLIRFRINHDVLLPDYLRHYTQTHRYWVWVRNTLRAGAQPNINAREYSSLPIPLPPLPEQRAIAAILGTWDRAITLTERRLAAAEQRKQALMQQLLTGRVRFPEFVKFTETQETKYGDLPADWKYVPLRQVAREIKVRNAAEHDYPVLSCTKYDGLVDSLEYFGRQIYSEDLSTYKVVREKQFAYATNHIEEGSIGYQDLHEAALISPMYTVFETNDRIDDSFLYKVLKTEKYRHIFEVNTNGTVNRRGSLRWGEFSQIHIPLPSLPEQRRIAAVLNACDRELELLRRKRDALQRQKKGLMQRLLTGRVRVTPQNR